MQMEKQVSFAFQDNLPSGDNPFNGEGSLMLPSSSNLGASTKPGKRPTRQWAAWTREEEESFFTALRLVGKNFEKITCRVQSKNKDQVRHYYYRLVRRMNKLLGPDFSLDAKNSKDTNAAMLRWWALLEKYSCKASKLHLKPRRFKIFIEALEHQLLKDRKKNVRRRIPQGGSCPSVSPTPSPQQNKPSVDETCAVNFVLVDSQNIQKSSGVKGPGVKRSPSTGVNKSGNKGDSSPIKASRQRRRSGGALSAAAIKKWEKAAIAGVSLVAEAAEHLERTTFCKEPEPSSALAHSFSQAAASSKEETCLGPAKVVPPPLINFSSDVPPQSGEENAGKLKLQLFPIDETTKRALEMDKHNPHLELTLSTRKKITSVMEHLTKKWGKSTVACGELMLFPYYAQRENVLKYVRWTRESFATAADVCEVIGNPPVFRLRYGWISFSELQSATSAAPLNMSDSNIRLLVDTTLGSWSNRMGKLASPGERQQASLSHNNVVLQCINETADYAAGCSGSDPEDNMLALSATEASMLPQRSGAIRGEGAGNCSALSAGVWADSLTNLSIGDLLPEVSDEDGDCVEAPLCRSPPCLEETPFTCDSFDAAIAAHILSHQNKTGFQSTLTSHSSLIWDAEETCDAFSFQRRTLNNKTVHNSSVATSSPACRDFVRTNCAGSDGFFKGLAKEEQMMDGAAQGCPMEGNLTPSEPNLPENTSSDLNTLTDMYWPESLGPLDLDKPSCRYYNQDLILGDSHGGLSRLIASSLDAFQNCSFFSTEKKETSSATGAQGKPLS